MSRISFLEAAWVGCYGIDRKEIVKIALEGMISGSPFSPFRLPIVSKIGRRLIPAS